MSRVLRFARVAMLEALPLLITAALTLLVLGASTRSDWKEVFFYNGDSLVLPLLSRSFALAEPFEWVFSTQTFLFPEYPVFWVCSVLAGSTKAALALNAVINALLLYVLLRIIVRFLAPGHRDRQLFFAALASIYFLAIVLSEPAANLAPPGIVDHASIATLFLTTTYYYGVILVSLAMIALVLWVTQEGTFAGPPVGARLWIFFGTTLVFSGLAMYSNPLYLLQLVLPIGATLALLTVARRISARWLLALTAPLVIGSITGGVFRAVFSQYLVSDFRSYLGVSQAPSAAKGLLFVILHWMKSPQGVSELLLLGIPLLAITGYAVWIGIRLVRSARGRAAGLKMPTVEILLMVFVAVSALSLLVGQVFTGQLLTRYLLPLFIFPLLGILLLANPSSYGGSAAGLRGPPRGVLPVGVSALTVGALAIAGISIAPIASTIAEDYAPAKCLDGWLAGRDASGVGPFMVVRPIDLYGTQSGKVLQVVDSVVVQPWMNNLARYDDTRFSYVLLDKQTDVTTVVDKLGEPASTYDCPTFTIYDYAGTEGEQTLNDWIGITLAIARNSR